MELNTFGHAICALLIYFLWWEKPFEVEHPTIVRSQDVNDSFALFWIFTHQSSSTSFFLDQLDAKLFNDERFRDLSKVRLGRSITNAAPDRAKRKFLQIIKSPISSTILGSHFFYSLVTDHFVYLGACFLYRLTFYPQDAERLRMWYLKSDASLVTLADRQPFRDSRVPAVDQKWRGVEFDYEIFSYVSTNKNHQFNAAAGLPKVTVAPGQNLPGTNLQLMNAQQLQNLMKQKLMAPVHPLIPTIPSLELTEEDVNRWTMAWRAVENHKRETHWEEEVWLAGREPLFVRQCRDLPSITSTTDRSVAFGFNLAAFVYGGRHALAWHAPFNTATEHLLWRISASVVMGGMPALYLFKHAGSFLIKSHSNVSMDLKGIRRYLRVKLITYIDVTLHFLFYSACLVYALARLYLVIECFINLSHMPTGVYTMPEWSTYFPHIA